MSIASIFLLLFIFLIFFVGLLGIFLPIIPSLPVIWGGILLYGILTNFSEVTWVIILITAFLMIFGTVVDVIAGIFGAKVYGASWVGVLGAAVGSIIGMVFFNIIGLFIGSFIGAFFGEYARYKKTHPALKAGIGTIFGFIFGVVTKIFISFLMIGIFIFALF